MSESWINRLWQLLLVCVFAVVLSVCNKALDESTDSGTSSGTAFADGPVTITAMPKLSVESTTTVSSMPALKTEISSMPAVSLDNGSSIAVSSMPSVIVASQAYPTISGMMICGYETQPMHNQGKKYYYGCAATDSTELKIYNVFNEFSSTALKEIKYAITLEDAFKAGSVITGRINQKIFIK